MSGGRPRKIPRRELTAERDAQIARMLDAGTSIRGTAKRVGVSPPTVYAAIARREAAIADFRSKPSILETRSDDLGHVAGEDMGFRDRGFTVDVIVCATCGRPRADARHRSDGPYLPSCDWRRTPSE